jgi:lipopolysaccharide export system protein LptA
VTKLFYALVIATLSLPAFAQDEGAKFGTLEEDSDKEIHATSDTMEVQEELGYAILEGNVVVIQGGSKLTAKKVRAEYTEDRSEIQTIIATGDVVLLSGGDIAKGDEAVYEIDKNTITLIGNAYVKQGKDTMNSERVLLNTLTGSSVMTGRVTTVLTPKKD